VFALVIARLVPAKGVDLAIKGVADLKNRGLDLSLVIVGDGPLRVELEKLARQLDVESCVRFMGSLHGPAVSSALRRSRCLIVPSRAEGFGIVCLEAMIAGRPVVASSTGGIPEIVADGETGWLVAPGDVRALADAVATVLQSPSVADEMGLRGRSRALTLFSWERMVEKYLASYFCALGGRLDRTKAPLA
jgi:glycosyltransferase involved in cell wall biosynthesis